MQQYKKILGKVMMTAEGTYNKDKKYEPISLVIDEETNKSYISRKEVPAGTQINNREYWQPVASSGIIDNGVIILNRKNNDGQIPIYDLKSATEAVAVGDRKGGVILGFLGFNPEIDTVPTWKLYQYNDVSPSNWTNIDYWLPMDYTNKYAGWFDNEEALYDSVPFPKVGMYAYVGSSATSAIIYRCYNDRIWQPTEDKAFSGVVNLADEEDITSKQNKLKFKDKEYNPAQFSGLGRIYLRKNMIDGRNILTQTMIQATNTIYIIQYDYDLQGQTITIPEGCILDFQGGSFSNGTIKGNNTVVKASLTKIFGLDVELIDSWNVAESYPEWFGAKGDGITDDTAAIQKCINYFYRIFFSYKTYICSCTDNVGLVIKTSKILCGNQWSNYEEHNNNQSIKFRNVNTGDVCIWVSCDQVKIENIQIKAENDPKVGIGIRHSKLNGGLIHGLTLDHVRIIGFGIGAELKSFLNILTKAYFSYCNWGLKIKAGIDAYPTSNSLRECYFDKNDNGLQIEGVYHSLLNCCFDVTAQTALHVMSTCSRLLCLQTSFESNKQAINNEGGYSKFIACYFLDNTYQWSTYEEAANYIRFKGDCGVIDNANFQINNSAGHSVQLGSNFKCIYAVNNNDFHPSLIIDGYFDVFNYIKSDSTANCIIKNPLWNYYRNHSNLTDRLTNQFKLEFYDVELKKPLWWDGSKWRDAMGNDADNMPAEKVQDVGNKDATYWDSIKGESYKGRVITGYHLGLNSGIVAIGTSAYTLQIANVYNTGTVKTRTYYSDGDYWTPWKDVTN